MRRVSFGFTDGALSLSEGSESSEYEFSEAESNSEDERVLRVENKARREEAAKAQRELELAAQAAKRKGRKRKSVTVTSQVAMAPLVTEQGTGGRPQTSKKSKRTAAAAGSLVSTPGGPVPLEAITASMGAAISAGMSATMQQMMEQQKTQHEQMRAYVVPKKGQDLVDDEDAYEEEDTVTVDESVHLVDNSVDVLDYAVRSKLRVPNSSSDVWWGKATVSQRVCRPVRGSSLYLENIQGATRPNDRDCKKVMS